MEYVYRVVDRYGFPLASRAGCYRKPRTYDKKSTAQTVATAANNRKGLGHPFRVQKSVVVWEDA